jgi:hypothetical protein
MGKLNDDNEYDLLVIRNDNYLSGISIYTGLTNSVSVPMTSTRKQDSRNVNEYLPESTGLWKGKNGGYEWKTTE